VIGKGNPKFVGLAGLNAVVAANAGGTISPLGGISTFFVWQQKHTAFHSIFYVNDPLSSELFSTRSHHALFGY